MSDITYFPEPEPDDTWARDEEKPIDWLMRSTLPRAVSIRAALNENLRRFPPGSGWEPREEAANQLEGSLLRGLYRFGELWIGLAEGPAFDDYASGSGQYAEQALRRLSDRLRERRGSAYG